MTVVRRCGRTPAHLAALALTFGGALLGCRDPAAPPAPTPTPTRPATSAARSPDAAAATQADAGTRARPDVPAGADPELAAALVGLPVIAGAAVSAPARIERAGTQLATTWCVPGASPSVAASALAAALRQGGYDEVAVRGAPPQLMVIAGKDGVRLAGRVGDGSGPGCAADARGWPIRIALFTERALSEPIVPDLDLDDPPDGL